MLPPHQVYNKMQMACKNILQGIILSSPYNNNNNNNDDDNNNNNECFTQVHILSAK